MFSSKDIRSVEFEVDRKGYNAEDVKSFLNQVADQYEAIEREKNAADAKMQVLAEKIEEYRKDEDNLKVALLGAQRMGDGILQEARQKADILIRDANLKAEKIVSASTQKLEREELALKKMQREVAKFKADVLGMYKTHLEGLSQLPDLEDLGDVAEQQPAPVAEPAIEPAAAEAPTQAAQTLDKALETTNEIPELTKDAFEQKPADQQSIFSGFSAEPEPNMDSPFAIFNTEPNQQPAGPAVNTSPYTDPAQQPVAPAAPAAEPQPANPDESKFGKLDFGDGFSFNS